MAIIPCQDSYRHITANLLAKKNLNKTRNRKHLGVLWQPSKQYTVVEASVTNKSTRPDVTAQSLSIGCKLRK